MKNKMITLLTLFMLTGAMLVGCGSSETGADNNAGANTEASADNKADTGKENTVEPTYEEGTDVFLISNNAYDTALQDGEMIDMNALEPASGEVVTEKEVNIYNQIKQGLGYIKSGVTVKVVTASEEWCYVTVTDGNYIVRTEELGYILPKSEAEYAAEDIAKIIDAIEDAGLVYDESAFEGEDLSSYEELSAYTQTRKNTETEPDPDTYGYILFNSMLMGMDDEEKMLSSISEYMQIYSGKSFIIEVVSDAGRNYDIEVYFK